MRDRLVRSCLCRLCLLDSLIRLIELGKLSAVGCLRVLEGLVLCGDCSIRGIELGLLLLGILLCGIKLRLCCGKIILLLSLILLGVFQSLLSVCLGALCGVKIGLGSVDLCLSGVVFWACGACLCCGEVRLCAVIRRLRVSYLTVRGGFCLLGGSQRGRRLVVSALRGALGLLGVGERGVGSGLCGLCLVKNLLGICGRLLGCLDFLRRCVGGCLLGFLKLGLCIGCRLLCGVECLRLALGIGLGRVELALGIL